MSSDDKIDSICSIDLILEDRDKSLDKKPNTKPKIKSNFYFI